MNLLGETFLELVDFPVGHHYLPNHREHNYSLLFGKVLVQGFDELVDFALGTSELVRGLVLIGPFVRQPATNALQNLLFRVLMARPWAAAAWNAYMPTLYAGTKPSDFTDYRQAAIQSMKRPGYGRAFSLTTRTDHLRAGECLTNVDSPTLVVMGEKDPDFKNPAAEADWIARTLRGSAVMVPDAGHYPQSQQPEITSTAIIDFLSELSDHV